MDISITAQCFVERESSLILDIVGNRLPVGSVIMCKLTPFFITKDGDINYVGGSKMEMVYQADDKYFEFLDQQVKEIHIERSQGFITHVYRALMGSRSKTRRKQVTGILPTPVTMESCSPTTKNKPSSVKTLEEDVTQDEFGDKLHTSLEELPEEESIPNNDLGESYVEEVQQGSKYVLLNHTDAEEHETIIWKHSQSFLIM